MPEAKCYLYDIVHPDPQAMQPTIWQAARQEMEKAGWIGESGKRIGFVSTIEHNKVIAGYFANEGQKRGFQYDNDKQPIDEPQFSFEHLFFAIFIDTSQLLLQSRNIYGYADLGMGDMRRNFLNLTAEFLRLSGVNIARNGIQIASSGTSYTSEELFAYFLNNPTTSIEIKNMDEGNIPTETNPRYKLYNPRDEWNPITWGAVSETLKVGAKNITLEANRNDPDAELNKGPLPKAFATIGEVEEVSTRTESGTIVVRKRTTDEEIRIDLPASPDVSIPILDVILNRFDHETRRMEWQERSERRKNAEMEGTLFDSGN